MPAVSIDIQGMDALYRKLGKVADVRAVIRPPMQRWTQQGLRDMQDYPPELPGQRYIRTFTLRGGWTGTVLYEPSGLHGGLTGRIRNANVPYNVYVQNDRRQARIHRGRWLTDEGWVNQNRTAILGSFRQAIQAEINR